MNILKKLNLIFTYGNELEQVLKDVKKKKEDEAFKACANHLNLCLKHQQERNHSHFSEKNCDYCKLLKLENQND